MSQENQSATCMFRHGSNQQPNTIQLLDYPTQELEFYQSNLGDDIEIPATYMNNEQLFLEDSKCMFSSGSNQQPNTIQLFDQQTQEQEFVQFNLRDGRDIPAAYMNNNGYQIQNFLETSDLNESRSNPPLRLDQLSEDPPVYPLNQPSYQLQQEQCSNSKFLTEMDNSIQATDMNIDQIQSQCQESSKQQVKSCFDGSAHQQKEEITGNSSQPPNFSQQSTKAFEQMNNEDMKMNNEDENEEEEKQQNESDNINNVQSNQQAFPQVQSPNPPENENIRKEQEVNDQPTQNDLIEAQQPYRCLCGKIYRKASPIRNHIASSGDEITHEVIERHVREGAPNGLTEDKCDILKRYRLEKKPLDKMNTPEVVGNILEEFSNNIINRYSEDDIIFYMLQEDKMSLKFFFFSLSQEEVKDFFKFYNARAYPLTKQFMQQNTEQLNNLEESNLKKITCGFVQKIPSRSDEIILKQNLHAKFLNWYFD